MRGSMNIHGKKEGGGDNRIAKSEGYYITPYHSKPDFEKQPCP
jgi:hypothetical protein